MFIRGQQSLDSSAQGCIPLASRVQKRGALRRIGKFCRIGEDFAQGWLFWGHWELRGPGNVFQTTDKHGFTRILLI